MYTLGTMTLDRWIRRALAGVAASPMTLVPPMKLAPAMTLMFGVLALSVLQADPARAQIALERAIVDFSADDQRRSDIEVTNTGDETLFIEVTPRLVQDPGEPDEERVEVRNPRELGLLASPRRMVLEAGQRNLLRLSLLKRPVEKDRIFRVRVTPKFNDFETERTGVRVVVAYNMLVIARPPDAVADLVATRNGRELKLANRGNSNALFLSGEQCAPGGGDCQDLPTRRMYAGNEWTVTLPYDTEATWTVRTPEGLEERSW